MQGSKIKKGLLIVGGSISLGLGILGVVLPVLPTTPFLLLAAFCYVRSSQRLYDWLLGHRLFGSYISNYLHHRAVAKKAKVTALVMLWTTLTISFILVDIWYVRLILVVVGLAVSAHILSLKTIHKK